MTFDDLVEDFLMTSRILNNDLETLVNCFYTERSYLYFLSNLYFFIKKDRVLFYDEELVGKINDFVIQKSFMFSASHEVRMWSIKIIRILRKKLLVNSTIKEANIREVLLEEKTIRGLSNDLSINRLIELYRRDYDNYIAIYDPASCSSEVYLFSFLSTVNKILNKVDDQDIYQKTINNIMIVLNILQSSEELDEYVESTEDIIMKKIKKK